MHKKENIDYTIKDGKGCLKVGEEAHALPPPIWSPLALVIEPHLLHFGVQTGGK